MDSTASLLQLRLLWPNFQALWDVLSGQTAQQWDTNAFSAAIVVTLLVLFIWFAGRIVVGAVRSVRRIGFFRRLLADINQDNLIEERSNIRSKAKAAGPIGEIWLEFDETLVHSPDGKLLWNTIDADHFFNTHTLASGVTESRLIAAVPGFLTAIGVIGTFAGLQLGLSGLNLTQANLDETGQQIQRIISSASVAFLTSVWGIGTSVLFNLFEKLVEQSLRKRIARLQDRVDTLFPRIRSEQTLVQIEDHERESRTTLQGLAERIGDRMQEALLGMSERIREGVSSSLAEVLAPAVGRLVDAASDLAGRQTDSSQEALQSLIHEFVSKVGEQGDRQRQMMMTASADVRKAARELSDGMGSFLEKMDQQIQTMESGQSRFVQSVGETVQAQLTETDRLLGQGEVLARQISSMSEDLTRIGADLKASSDAMQSSSSNLATVGDQLERTVTHFSGTLDEATKSTREYVEETRSLQQVIAGSLEFLSGFEQRTRETTEAVNKVADTVQRGLTELAVRQDRFLAGMQEELTKIQDQVAELLRRYGEQVSGQTVERLNEWNVQTRQFVSSMVAAVNSINEVVEEVADAVERLRQ